MSESERTVTVNVEEAVRLGVFANAFRVVEDTGPDCLLDFMVYSSAEHEATVVVRVRVRREFLPAIRETLREALSEFEEDDEGQMTATAVCRKAQNPVH